MTSNRYAEDSFFAAKLFKDIPQARVQSILEAGIPKKFQKKDMLFHQGAPADKCFFVLSGRLKLTKLHIDGQEALIRYIGPGEIAGAAAVLRGNEYPVTANSLSETAAVCWNKRMLIEVMEQYPKIAINTLCIVLERLEEMQQRFLEINAEQAEQRLARTILRIMQHAGKQTDKGILINIDLSREDLADFTGTTHYTISRILSSWSRKGWINTRQRRITILDAHALVTLTETAAV